MTLLGPASYHTRSFPPVDFVNFSAAVVGLGDSNLHFTQENLSCVRQ